jgi:DNA repair exonuclease SbcCD ATPase subunit
MFNCVRLYVQNFMCFKQQIIHLDNQGLVRIEGKNLDDPSAESNMAGKSSILEALVWVLYGRTIRGLKHDEIIHSGSKTGCSVSLLFNKDKVCYMVRRYRKHPTHHNDLRIYANNRPLYSRHTSATENTLASILECDFITFCNSVLFGGVRPFASLTDSEQKRILESFLQFSQVDRALIKTRAKLVQVEENISGLCLKIQGQQNLIRELKSQISSSSEVTRNIEEERSIIKREIKSLRDIKPCLKKLRLKEKSYSFQLERQYELSGQKSSLEEKLFQLSESLNNSKDLIGKPCPVCKRDVTGSTLVMTLAHLRREQAEVTPQISELSYTIARLQKSVALLAREVVRLQERQKKYEYTVRRKASLRERLGGLAQIVPLNRSLEYKYSRAVSLFLGMQRKKAELEREEKNLRFWEIGFGNKGIKASIVRKALPWLNQTLEEYAEKVFGGPTELKFSAAKELKSGEERELFHIQYGKVTGYTGESSGGRRRIDIAVLLTFAALSRVCNLLLVDELLDGLDEAGRENVLEILGTLRGTVLVISHRRELKGGKVWTVIKRNGVSHLAA